MSGKNQIVYDYQQYISSLIEKEFYNEKFLRELADLFGYDLVKKDQNYNLIKKVENKDE